MKAIVLLVALLLPGAASAQSIAIPDHTYEVAEGYATVNVLANGERWLLIHGQEGLGIQLQPEMPVTSQFATNIVLPGDDDGSSTQLSIVGDCQAKTFEIMSAQSYSGSYRTGDPVGPRHRHVAFLVHVEPDTSMVWVFASVCYKP